MTGDGTDEAPAPDERPEAPKRRRRRRRRGGKRPQGSNGGAAQAPRVADAAVREPRGSGAQRSSGRGGGGAKGGGAKGGGAKGGGRRRRGTPPKGGKKGSGQGANAKLPWTREVSAGGVVYRRTDGDGIEVVLASRRTRRGDLAWGLAKGGIEDGESREDAAIREVREETGLTAEIEADLGTTKYMYVWDDVRIRKTVHFFLMRYTGGNVDDRDDEMEEIRWFPMERALKRAAYRGERDVLKRAVELLS